MTQPVPGTTGPADAPVRLTADHDTSAFVCRHESLRAWLGKRALANAATGAARTDVVVDEQRRVIGYYALAAGSIAGEAAPGRPRRNMPDPLPVIVLGLLAVHGDWSGRGIGSGLLKDAVLRSSQAAELIGARALLCHAIDEQAKAFYFKHGFAESPIDPLTVLVGLRQVVSDCLTKPRAVHPRSPRYCRRRTPNPGQPPITAATSAATSKPSWRSLPRGCSRRFLAVPDCHGLSRRIFPGVWVSTFMRLCVYAFMRRPDQATGPLRDQGFTAARGRRAAPKRSCATEWGAVNTRHAPCCRR